MATPKRYFHDKLILALLSVMVFFILLSTVIILLKLSSSGSSGYIVTYRSTLGLGGYKPGGALEFVSFIIFGFLVFALHLYASLRLYHVRRYVSIAVLVLGVLLLILSTIASNALLELGR